MHAEAPRDELVTLAGALRPGYPALEHDAAQRLLGCVVRRLDTGMSDESPKRRPQREQVRAGIGRAGAPPLLGSLLQSPANPAHDGFELLCSGPAASAPAEHHITQTEQPPPDAPGLARPLSDAHEVSNKVRPAHLAPPGVEVAIGGIPVGDHHAAGLRTDQVQRHVARPGGQDAEDRQLGLDRTPYSVGRTLARVSGLVHVQDRRTAERGGRLGHRRLQRRSHLAMRLRDGAYAEVQAQRVRQRVSDLPLRQVKARAHHADQCERPWADLAAGHTRGQCRPMAPSALSAHSAVEPIFDHLGHDRRNVEHLVAQRLALHAAAAATVAHLHRCAVVDGIDFGLGQQCAVRAGVSLLGATLALTCASLGSVAASRAIR